MPPQTTISAGTWRDLGLLTLLWGSSFLAIRIALDEIGPITVVTHRVFWAALALWAYVLVRRLPLPRDAATWGTLAVMGLLNNVIPFSLIAWGQQHIESGLASILNATSAVFSLVVAACLFQDERITPRRALGVGLGAAGVATAVGLDRLLTFDPRALGQLAVLGATVSYAFSAAWARARLGHLRPEVAATGMLTASSLMLVPLARLIEGPFVLALAPPSLVAIGFIALFSTAGAYLLYYRIIAAAGASNAMLVTLTIPPVAIILGAVVRNEALPVSAYVGFGLLAAGLAVLNGAGGRKRRLSPKPQRR